MLLAKIIGNDFFNSFYVVYHSLILIAFILAVLSYRKGGQDVFYLMLMLLSAFVVEAAAGFFKYYHIKGQSWIYHVYNLVEYAFLSMYYIRNCNVIKFKQAVGWSMIIFILFGLVVSSFLYHFHSMPALNINVEGLLLCLMYTHLLFSIETDVKLPVYGHPDFWISVGVLIFFGGAFVYFNVYRTLLHLNYEQTLMMFGRIMNPLNIVLYVCIIIGLLCLHLNRKFLPR